MVSENQHKTVLPLTKQDKSPSEIVPDEALKNEKNTNENLCNYR